MLRSVHQFCRHAEVKAPQFRLSDAVSIQSLLECHSSGSVVLVVCLHCVIQRLPRGSLLCARACCRDSPTSLTFVVFDEQAHVRAVGLEQRVGDFSAYSPLQSGRQNREQDILKVKASLTLSKQSGWAKLKFAAWVGISTTLARQPPGSQVTSPNQIRLQVSFINPRLHTSCANVPAMFARLPSPNKIK